MAASAATLYSTYAKYYNNEASDLAPTVHRGNIEAMAVQDGETTFAGTHRENQFLTEDTQHHCYLILTHDGTDYTISVLHRLHRHHLPQAGGTPKCTDIAFLGDVTGLQPPLVVLAPSDPQQLKLTKTETHIVPAREGC